MYVSQLSFILLRHILYGMRLEKETSVNLELLRQSGHLGQLLCFIHRIPLGTSDYAFHS